MKRWHYLLVVCVAVVIFGCRWFGPSDLYDNDQPKTAAYTVDMVRHGRWLLPMDMLGRPATKPPMYNWIGATVVAAGWHSEFALKLPSTLAALMTLGVTLVAARWTARRIVESGSGADQERTIFINAFTVVACIALLANYSFVKLCYTARPDMVLTAYLALGWVLATWLLADARSGQTVGRSWLMRGVLWLCVAGAALTKGPPALLLVIYVVLGGKLLTGQWKSAMRTGIVWGLPLALLLVGLWAYGAYHSNPEHFSKVFMGDETVNRIGRGGVLGIVASVWKMPVMFVLKFFPWSVFALMGAWHVLATKNRARWFVDPIGPAMLWVMIVIVFFSLSGGKRPDYLAPAYPAASVLAAFWLICEGKRLLGLRLWYPVVMGVAYAFVLGAFEWGWSAAATEGYGPNLIEFVQQVKQQTQGQPIRFGSLGYTPVQTLLGYNQPPDDRDTSASPWLIAPLQPGDREPVVISKPIYDGDQQHVILALYPNTGNVGTDAKAVADRD